MRDARWCAECLDSSHDYPDCPPADQFAPACPRCGSPRWVSVSLDGGWSRRAQCVPCGAYHPGVIGPGWQSPRFADTEAVAPAYREGKKP